jgi:hypothetical protein
LVVRSTLGFFEGIGNPSVGKKHERAWVSEDKKRPHP